MPGNPDPIDVEIGKRIRARRMECGLNQTQLGRKLGVTFQQVQKYEKGANRISGSMIDRACAALDVEPNYFFSRTGGPDVVVAGDGRIDRSTNELVRLFGDMPEDRQRSLLSVARALSGPSMTQLAQAAAT